MMFILFSMFFFVFAETRKNGENATYSTVKIPSPYARWYSRSFVRSFAAFVV